MKLDNLTFKGGVHIFGRKGLSNNKPWTKAEEPKVVTIAMHQHIGAPCDPLVEVGDYVKVGQKIGESPSFMSAPVHSSISGNVLEIKEIKTFDGKKCKAVIIENDFKDELGFETQNRDYNELSSEEIISIIKEAGITGQGGASFPTHVKLSPPKENPIDVVILNGAECEPFITCDQLLMEDQPNKVIDGLKIIMKTVGAKIGYISVEENKPKAIQILRDANKYDDIKVVSLKAKYPQGDEKRIINATVDRIVPSGGLPMHVGVVVDNVTTSAAVYEAVVTGKPLYERLVTVTGMAINNPINMLTKVGTDLSLLIKTAGGFSQKPGKIIAGGPMMGMAQKEINVPTAKAFSCILSLTEEEAKPPIITDCMKCGKCVEVCPVNLLPLYIAQRSENKLYDDAKILNAMDCIECGSCSYVCPAKRPLIENIKVAKNKIRTKEQKRK